MKNNIKGVFVLLIFVFLLSGLALLAGNTAQAADEVECITSLDIIARNQAGNYIGDINFEVYNQVHDVDGNLRPGKKVTEGRTSALYGSGGSNIDADDFQSTVVLKMWHSNSSVGAFWFYDNIIVGCAGNTITKTLGGINVVLRDTENNLVKNKLFKFYTQRYDVDNRPLNEKSDFVANFNTSGEGETTAYIGNHLRTIDGQGSDYYVFEADGQYGAKYTMYNIKVNDGNTTKLEYIFSDIAFTVKDSKGNLFPANTKIEIFEQKLDFDDQKMIGQTLANVYTDDKGIAIFEYPAGIYAARIKGGDGEYHYFWDLQMTDQERNEILLKTTDEWQADKGACEAKSELTIVARTIAGDYIPGIKFELYVQELDVNGDPIAGGKAVSGQIEATGQDAVLFNPDPRKIYALKLYDKNATVGDYWYFDNIKFTCGQDKQITKTLSSIKFVLRDGLGNLKKNKKFSVYTQQFDIDGNLIKEKKDLVATLNTGEAGLAVIYVAPDHPYIYGKRGRYVFSSPGDYGSEFLKFNIDVSAERDTVVEYIFSNIIFELSNGAGELMPGVTMDIYGQEVDLRGTYVFSEKKIASLKTGANGDAIFEYPAGTYALRVKDDVGAYIKFWNIQVLNQQSIVQKIATNLVRVSVKDPDNVPITGSGYINVYSVVKDSETGKYYKGAKLKSKRLTVQGYADFILSSQPYLFTYKPLGSEYGVALTAEQGTLQKLEIKMGSEHALIEGNTFDLGAFFSDMAGAVSDSNLVNKLKGFILLQVEAKGEAWYVDETSRQRYYMKNGDSAFGMMKKFGHGITNENLDKIEIGYDSRFQDEDLDGDGLSDKLEEAIGTDMFDADSDSDGFKDGTEVMNGFDPLGPGRSATDKAMGDKLRGKIMLQVESRGEAWYINPNDGKRYYMKNGDSAYKIMRFLSLGITNFNLGKISEGSIN